MKLSDISRIERGYMFIEQRRIVADGYAMRGKFVGKKLKAKIDKLAVEHLKALEARFKLRVKSDILKVKNRNLDIEIDRIMAESDKLRDAAARSKVKKETT